MTERKVGTYTLLRHREKIDKELATREELDPTTFKQVHAKCNTTLEIVGWEKMGYSPNWDDFLNAPIKIIHCSSHGTTSLKFTDFDAFFKGQIGYSST